MKEKQTFGERIRQLRKQRGEPLRVIAAALEMDSTLLSKIERGERFPTNEQLVKFARYFKMSLDDLAAQVIADKIVSEYGNHPRTLQAIKIVKERVSPYMKE